MVLPFLFLEPFPNVYGNLGFPMVRDGVGNGGSIPYYRSKRITALGTVKYVVSDFLLLLYFWYAKFGHVLDLARFRKQT